MKKGTSKSNTEIPVKPVKAKKRKKKNVDAEKIAKRIFMSYYKITCSVLDAKSCSLYHIKEMHRYIKVFVKGDDLTDAARGLAKIKHHILDGVKMD